MLLQMSIAGGVLILFITACRLLALNRLPKKLFMLLWDIALLRLLLPVNLPFSYGISTPAVQIADNGLRSLTITERNLSGIHAGRPVMNIEAGLSRNTVMAFSLPLLIYLLGVITFLTLFIVSYRKEHRRIQDALPLPEKTEADLRILVRLPKRVRLYVSDRLSTPLTYGILSPKIILSKVFETMDEAQFQYVLTHELVHIKRADNFRKLLMLTAVSIHWFNPAVWIMYILYNRDMELSCDEKVITLLGEQNKKDYAMALITLADRQHSLSLFSAGFVKNTVKERITAIMKYKKATILSILFAVLSVGIAGTAFAENATSDTTDVTVSFSQQDSSTASASQENTTTESNDFYFSFIRSENFKEYEKLGLSYDINTNRLMYDGHVVAYFHDEIAPSVYTHIYRPAVDDPLAIGIVVSRDADYNILALEKADIPDYTGNDNTVESPAADSSTAIGESADTP